MIEMSYSGWILVADNAATALRGCERPQCFNRSSALVLGREPGRSLALCPWHTGEFIAQSAGADDDLIRWADGLPVMLRDGVRVDLAKMPWPSHVIDFFRTEAR